MGAVTARAEQLAQLLKDAGASASCDVRKVKRPGFLVIPIPRYSERLLGGEVDITWTVMAIVDGIGDLKAAEQLEELVAVAYTVLDVDTVEPGSYTLPGVDSALPAYSITLTDSITP